MTSKEIYDRIYSCESEADIESLVNERIEELEKSSKEETMGQGYTDIYRNFISSKVHYKPAAKIGDGDCPDLLYDDMSDYTNLIKDIKKSKSYNLTSLFTSMLFSVDSSLPSNEDERDRLFVYMSNASRSSISIKEIKKLECAFCSEKAGLAHNMLKFLGYDSELICGQRDGVNHTYNLVFPNGYDNSPAVLYDPSHHIDYINGAGNKISFGYFIELDESQYNLMLVGNMVDLSTEKTTSRFERFYRMSDRYPDYKVQIDKAEYGIGLKIKNNVNADNKTI